ncbi:MAG TPA: putative zinc-binding metallopeptidase [Myxococcales bacterium]|nr:putative zinc-binding metallopeptidase [Myxococcales bacterium]
MRSFQQMQSFEHTPPEARTLLSRPIRELGLRVEGSTLERYVQQLYAELEGRGLSRFRPGVYLSDEWACPDREPVIGVPFYLADPKLQALERAVNDLEDEREILMYLRHEAGHAFNYAYMLYESKEWLDLFGPFDRPYLDDYTPVPFSRKYVRHIAGWYAQKHPDEDFAETFAVWLTPDSDWRRRYAGWPALKKLQYVERIARELATLPPRKAPEVAVRELPVEEMGATLEQFYKEHEQDERAALADLLPDAELEDIFVRKGEDLRPASAFLLEHRKTIVDKITYWTGVRRSLVRKLVEIVGKRARELELSVERKRETQVLIEVVAFATTLAMNYLTRGRFAER